MMTDYLAARSATSSTSSTTNSHPVQLNRLVAPSKRQNNLLEASSSSLQMNRTGSAGAPSPPESPVARNRLAATGFSPSPLVRRNVGGAGLPIPRSPQIQVHSPEGSLALARLNPAAVGLSRSPLARRGFPGSPAPFVRLHTPESIHKDGQWSNANGEAVSSVDLLNDEGSESLLASYSLLGARFDIGSFSSTNLDVGDGVSATNSSINVGRQTFADGKRERIVIQTSTFTNWVNDRLKVGKHDRKVGNLFKDLKDGMLLIKLLENLTKKKVAGFNGTTPKTEPHKRVNLDLAFQFMQTENIKMIGVGGMNIYQGDTTLTLGMIWMLIQKYQIRMQGYKVSTKQVMIHWVQALLPKWGITNLTSDWTDGRALIAIINAVKPGIAPNVASLDPTKRRQNCILAIKIAHSYLKIPKIISPDDLSSGAVDDLSVMTYLSYFVEPFRVKLLKWVQKILPQFTISGFSKDWYSGRAFGSMVRACFPNVFVNWAQLEMNSDLEYINELFKTVKRKLGITPPFQAADLASGKVEELQVMTMAMLIRSGDLIPLSDDVTVRGPGIEAANFHKETSFLIDTTQAGPGQLYIDAYYEEDGEKLRFNLKEKASRVFSLIYTPVQTSKLIFDITWSEVRIPKSPFVVPVTDSTLVKIIDFESHNTVVEARKPLMLLLDARKAGHGRMNAYLHYGKEKTPVTGSVLANGNIRLNYTPTKSGTAVLRILWNKEELHHLAVTYTVVDVGGYSVHSFPQKKAYCVFEEPGFWILSEKGLPLNVLEMTAILSYDLQVPIKFKSIEGKKGYASFTPTLPGTYRIEVVCVNQLIQGTPFNVIVTDPHSCKVKGVIPSFLRLHKPHLFEVDIKEAGVGDITFESSDHDVSSFFQARLMYPNSADLQTLEVTPLQEGNFLVGIKYQKQWISNSPFRLQICDPTKFRVMEKLNTACVGKPVEFTVNAKEKCSNGIKVFIKASGPSARYSPQIQLSEDGLRHSVKFIPWEIGDHEIKIQYGEFDIPQSPIVLPVITFDADVCSAAGSGLQRAYASIPSHFLVLSRQEGLLEDGTLQVRVSSVIDSSDCRIRARDNKNGTYSIAYLIQSPGAYLISVVAAGQHIPGSPFKLNALPGPEAHKCRMFGPALEEETILTFGKPIDFTVDTSRAGTGKLSVKAIGPEGASARVFIAKTDQPGKYDISIDALRHGKHRVSVKWSNRHIPCSPFRIKVFPGADSRKCLAHGPGLEDGWVGKKSSFTIDTKNAGAGLLKVRLHGIKGAFKIEIAPIDQRNRRTLLANYNPTQPGEYLITIKWSEMHVPGSPFRVKITGSGTKNNPTILLYTPTPRLPEVDDFEDAMEEDESDDDAVQNDNLRALGSGSSLIKQQQKKSVAFHPSPLFRNGVKERHRRGSGGKMVTFSSLQVPKTKDAVRSSPLVRNAVRSSPLVRNAVRSSPLVRNAVRSSPLVRNAVRSSPLVRDGVRSSQRGRKSVKKGEFEGQVTLHVKNQKNKRY